MHVRLLAVGDRQPAWVDQACSDYEARLPQQWKFHIDTVATARRTKNTVALQAKAQEGKAILEQVRPAEFVVVLDERGTLLTTEAFERRLGDWQAAGRDLCFVIGGPDGLADEVRDRADYVLSLSKLTLPHGLARIMLTEQLFRAWSLSTGHPYHRA